MTNITTESIGSKLGATKQYWTGSAKEELWAPHLNCFFSGPVMGKATEITKMPLGVTLYCLK
jgi:hypothetical protein